MNILFVIVAIIAVVLLITGALWNPSTSCSGSVWFCWFSPSSHSCFE